MTSNKNVSMLPITKIKHASQNRNLTVDGANTASRG